MQILSAQFSLAFSKSGRGLSGVQERPLVSLHRHNVSFPPSGNGGYNSNQDVPYLSLTRRCVDVVTLGVPVQSRHTLTGLRELRMYVQAGYGVHNQQVHRTARNPSPTPLLGVKKLPVSGNLACLR